MPIDYLLGYLAVEKRRVAGKEALLAGLGAFFTCGALLAF
jgi:hypothetical protein